jgi:UPF0716 protein FxsA
MWVFLAILAVPLIEIGLFVQLGGAIGLWPTLIWVILSAAFGILILKGVAMTGSVTLSRSMHELNNPLSPVANRVMVVFAGALLILPGFFTDAFGLLLLIPPVRMLLIRLIGRRLSPDAPVNTNSTIIEGEWREAKPENPTPPGNPPSEVTRH